MAAVGYQYQQHHSGPPVDGALQPGKGLVCALQHVEPLNHNTSRFRFSLPSSRHVLGLPTASHIVAVDNAMVARAYTPVTLDKFDKGYFDLIIKRYDNGYFSEWFHKLVPGDTMEFRGPMTTLHYEPNAALCLGMIAGGTGITPMYQVIRTVLSTPEDTTQIRLVYANNTEEDIILRDELNQLEAEHPAQLQVKYVVSHPAALRSPPAGAAEFATRGGVTRDTRPLVTGRVDATCIEGFLPAPDEPRTAVLVCGPDGMMRHLCGDASIQQHRRRQGLTPILGGLLRQMGYARQVVQFLDDLG